MHTLIPSIHLPPRAIGNPRWTVAANMAAGSLHTLISALHLPPRAIRDGVQVDNGCQHGNREHAYFYTKSSSATRDHASARWQYRDCQLLFEL